VGPSPTETDMIRGVPNEKIQAFVDALPVPRLTTFEDISNVVDFFLLDSSEAVTGQVIYLNGMPNIG
jgi:3-oxoacyl-[acyl-carrier protein] reductase